MWISDRNIAHTQDVTCAARRWGGTARPSTSWSSSIAAARASGAGTCIARRRTDRHAASTPAGARHALCRRRGRVRVWTDFGRDADVQRRVGPVASARSAPGVLLARRRHRLGGWAGGVAVRPASSLRAFSSTRSGARSSHRRAPGRPVDFRRARSRQRARRPALTQNHGRPVGYRRDGPPATTERSPISRAGGFVHPARQHDLARRRPVACAPPDVVQLRARAVVGALPVTIRPRDRR